MLLAMSAGLLPGLTGAFKGGVCVCVCVCVCVGREVLVLCACCLYTNSSTPPPHTHRSPSVMKPYIGSLADSMLITCVYDREINCRRAASAAFQENVGRQGNENFPNGIDIITIADYFSLGNRSHAFTHVAPLIAAMTDGNHEVLMFHLLDVKAGHWDVDVSQPSARLVVSYVLCLLCGVLSNRTYILRANAFLLPPQVRRLASHALAALVPLNPTRALEVLEELFVNCFSTSFTTRHGAVLCVAEVVLALVQTTQAALLTESIVETIAQLVCAWI